MGIDSSQWDAVSELKPARLPGVEFAEHQVRKESWLFVHNDVTGQHARINGLARHVVKALDAQTSIKELIENVASDTDSEEKEAVAASLIALSQLGMISLCDAHANVRIQHRVKELVSQKKPIGIILLPSEYLWLIPMTG